MSALVPSPPVKPFAAVFAGASGHIAAGIRGLNAILGAEPDLASPELPLVETDYYEKEMGPGLVKVYASWPGLRSPESLVEIKLAAMEWESRHAPDGRRQANLDPGYVFSGGLVLSTGKFREHRLPLGRGVWGELTLNYRRGGFQPLPWTYPDYRRPEVQAWLLRMREAYLSALKAAPDPGRCS
ncbi:MAG: DUF4416 family protein [Candidatus Adiutrix sp.]|nr:DUF4416 family protein [Candidatus Adiutrix sp.]